MRLLLYADDITPCTFSPELDTTLKRLKTRQLKCLNGFIKTVENLTLINAILSQPKSQEEIQIEETSLASANRVKLLCNILTGD